MASVCRTVCQIDDCTGDNGYNINDIVRRNSSLGKSNNNIICYANCIRRIYIQSAI